MAVLTMSDWLSDSVLGLKASSALPSASEALVLVAILGSIFNAVMHSILALVFIFKPETGKPLWLRMAPGRAFEHPGVGVWYMLSSALPELFGLFKYAHDGHDGFRRLIAYQIFAMGGCCLYQHLVLSRPRDWDRQFQLMITFEWIFVAGCVLDEAVGVPLAEALQIYVGCKLAGCLWSHMVARALLLLGVARWPRAKPEEEALIAHKSDGSDGGGEKRE